MDDQTKTPNSSQPVSTPPMPSAPPITPPSQPIMPTSEPIVPPTAPAEPVIPPQPVTPPTSPQDANKDLQSLSQDLENLAKEAVATAPAAPAAVPATAPVPEEKKETSANKITIYTTASCPFCKAEKEYLSQEKLTFTEKNVEEDTEALKEMLNLGDNFAGVPVTVLEGPKGKKVVKGFTKEEFIKELSEVGLKEATVSAAPPPTTPAEPVDKSSATPTVPDLK